MKAVVVELKGDKAVTLCKNGEFLRVKRQKSYDIGSEVEISGQIKLNAGGMTRIVSIAASILFVIGLGYAVYSYNAPYSYLNIDINPSVEITTNIYDRIIKCRPLNDDAKALLAQSNYQNEKLEDGVDSILKTAAQKGYFDNQDKDAVMITVSGKNDEKVQEIETQIKDSAVKEVKKASQDAEVLVEKVPLEKHEEAKKTGESPGKLMLIDQLKKADPKINTKDYINKPVKEIMNAIRDAQKRTGTLNNDQKPSFSADSKSNTKNTDKNSVKKAAKDSTRANIKDNTGKKANSKIKPNNKDNSKPAKPKGMTKNSGAGKTRDQDQTTKRWNLRDKNTQNNDSNLNRSSKYFFWNRY
ncbi:MAG: anti-sigma factor domain-containing protein [Bacillota bacterium]|nr:anti-sigma factor domain-containing protein [Bacillota bacterium]